MDYCDNPDASSYCNSFIFSKGVVIISMVSGWISTIASILTITVIFRSQIRLSSVYHRIIFGMSVSDTIGSIAMALTTIPMPTDQIYPFEGGMIYGTTTTCEIQGFAYVFGIGGSYFYNCGLCFFYLCIIKFRCSDQKIRRYVEPTIHLLGLVVTSIGAVSFELFFSILGLEGLHLNILVLTFYKKKIVRFFLFSQTNPIFQSFLTSLAGSIFVTKNVQPSPLWNMVLC